jgi:hypothetical protein
VLTHAFGRGSPATAFREVHALFELPRAFLVIEAELLQLESDIYACRAAKSPRPSL